MSQCHCCPYAQWTIGTIGASHPDLCAFTMHASPKGFRWYVPLVLHGDLQERSQRTVIGANVELCKWPQAAGLTAIIEAGTDVSCLHNSHQTRPQSPEAEENTLSSRQSEEVLPGNNGSKLVPRSNDGKSLFLSESLGERLFVVKPISPSE